MDPIQQQWRENMQACMAALTEAMPGVGMCLFLFGQEGTGGRVNYIANTERSVTVGAVRAWLERQVAHMPPADIPRSMPAGTTPQRAAFEAMVRAGLKLPSGHEGQGQTRKMQILQEVADTVARAVLEAAAP
jgi:hypothetical protein